MHKSMKIYINSNGRWIDVSDKEAVIFGAGQGCLDMLNDLKLPNVRYIIDTDKGKWGRDILIQNKIYSIESPDLLTKLVSEHYYVVISSIQYRKEIEDVVKKMLHGGIAVCVWHTGIRYSYDTIEDMFSLDPIINKKIHMFNLSFYRYQIICDFYKIIGEIFGNIKIRFFIPIRQGESKLIFLFGMNEKIWVYSVQGIAFSMDEIVINKYENEIFSEKIEFINRYLKDELTIYRNKRGVLIQKYAHEKLDFYDRETRKYVVEECRRIHSITKLGLREGNFIASRFQSHRNKIKDHKNRNKDILCKIDEMAEKNLCLLNTSNNKTLIHGDLIFENIMKYNEKIVFIDWEYLAIGNPMIDISYFLYSIHFFKYSCKEISFKELCEKCFEELPELVKCYCKVDVIVIEYIKDALAAMKMYLIINVLSTYFRDSEKGVEEMKILLMW